jgi:hypothetical protein
VSGSDREGHDIRVTTPHQFECLHWVVVLGWGLDLVGFLLSSFHCLGVPFCYICCNLKSMASKLGWFF